MSINIPSAPSGISVISSNSTTATLSFPYQAGVTSYTTNVGTGSSFTYSFQSVMITTQKSLSLSSTGQYMYVAGSNNISNSGLHYIWSSSNSGVTWSPATSNAAFYSGSNPTGSWKVINSDQTGQYVVSAGTIGSSSVVYNSTSYGQFWSASTGNNATGNANAICSNAAGNIVYIAYNPGQIYYSNNYGATFSLLSGSTSSTYTDLACDSTGAYVYAASTDSSTGGVYYSANSGSTWTRVYTGQCLSVVCTNTNNGSTAFTGKYGANKMVQTTNSGATWQTVTSSPTGSISSYYGYISCNQSATTIYISPYYWQNNVIYQSTNSGASFQTVIPVTGGYSFPYTFTSPYGTSGFVISNGTAGSVSTALSSIISIYGGVGPLPPTGLTLISVTSTTATISFTEPSGTISYYTPSSGKGSGTASSYTISGLFPNTNYVISLMATNSSGFKVFPPRHYLFLRVQQRQPAFLLLASLIHLSRLVSVRPPETAISVGIVRVQALDRALHQYILFQDYRRIHLIRSH